MKRRGFLGLLAGGLAAALGWTQRPVWRNNVLGTLEERDRWLSGLFREVPLERARLEEVDVEFDPTEWPETRHEHSFEGPSEYRLIERTHADGSVLVYGDGAAVGRTGFLLDPRRIKRGFGPLVAALGGPPAVLAGMTDGLRQRLRYWPGAGESAAMYRANQGPLPLVRI